MKALTWRGKTEIGTEATVEEIPAEFAEEAAAAAAAPAPAAEEAPAEDAPAAAETTEEQA